MFVNQIKRPLSINPSFKRAIRLSLQYLNNATRSAGGHKDIRSWLSLLYWLPAWLRSFAGHHPLSYGTQPWLTFPAVRFLKRTLRPEWRVFEYGSGRSTIFFALRCQEVVSVEHNGAWADQIRSSMNQLRVKNCRLIHVDPENPADISRASYASCYPGLEHCSFERYVKTIDNEPDQSIDLILVDGRARVDCIRHAISKVKPGGMLILDDAERSRYSAGIATVPSNWRKIDLSGPSAETEYFPTTTVWIAPSVERDRRRVLRDGLQVSPARSG